MPTLSPDRIAYLEAELITDAYCVLIIMPDGTEQALTSYFQDLEMSQRWDIETESLVPTSRTYKANTGYEMTALSSNASLAVDNVDVKGVYDLVDIKRDDVLSGAYDGARVFVFLTNYLSPIEFEHPLKKGTFGLSRQDDRGFEIEFRGLTQFLGQSVGSKITQLSSRTLEQEHVPMSAGEWQPSTTYTAADARKPHDWKGATVIAPNPHFWYYLFQEGTTGATPPAWTDYHNSVLDDGTCRWVCFHAYRVSVACGVVSSRKAFVTPSLAGYPDDWFKGGYIEFTTGQNAGYSMEVTSSIAGAISLFQNMPNDINSGDQFTITVGYDRTFSQCKNKFDNSVNFGGFPHLPGPLAASKFGGQ